jgi:uncharacterized protein YqgV (UPF0045/DUF77 family)
MEIAVELSLYPLRADYIPPIEAFIARLRSSGRVKVVTNSLSTQLFGEYAEVFELLGREMRATFDETGKAVFAMKVIGPLAQAGGS